MLVLSRKPAQSVVITCCGSVVAAGGRLVVTVLELDRGNVRLGFDAPLDFVINRGEVQEQIDGRGPGEAAP